QSQSISTLAIFSISSGHSTPYSGRIPTTQHRDELSLGKWLERAGSRKCNVKTATLPPRLAARRDVVRGLNRPTATYELHQTARPRDFDAPTRPHWAPCRILATAGIF